MLYLKLIAHLLYEIIEEIKFEIMEAQFENEMYHLAGEYYPGEIESRFS